MCCVHAKQTNKQKPIKKKGGAFLSSDTAVLIPGYFHPGAFIKFLCLGHVPDQLNQSLWDLGIISIF